MRLLVVVKSRADFEQFIRIYFTKVDPSNAARFVMVQDRVPPLDPGTAHLVTYVSGSIDVYEQLAKGGAAPVVILDQWLQN